MEPFSLFMGPWPMEAFFSLLELSWLAPPPSYKNVCGRPYVQAQCKYDTHRIAYIALSQILKT